MTHLIKQIGIFLKMILFFGIDLEATVSDSKNDGIKSQLVVLFSKNFPHFLFQLEEHVARLGEDKDNKKHRDGFVESSRTLELVDGKEMEGLAETMFKGKTRNAFYIGLFSTLNIELFALWANSFVK